MIPFFVFNQKYWDISWYNWQIVTHDGRLTMGVILPRLLVIICLIYILNINYQPTRWEIKMSKDGSGEWMVKDGTSEIGAVYHRAFNQASYKWILCLIITTKVVPQLVSQVEFRTRLRDSLVVDTSIVERDIFFTTYNGRGHTIIAGEWIVIDVCWNYRWRTVFRGFMKVTCPKRGP